MDETKTGWMSSHQNVVFLVLALAFGAALLWPTTNVQWVVAQGDHGLLLCVSDLTQHGALPYRDYWWPYGPLMPVYYALCFKLLCVTIHSVLIGQAFLNLVTGVLIYLTLSRLIVPYMALLAAVSFWIFPSDFFFTYNHTGGVTLGAAVAYAAVAYAAAKKTRFLVMGLVAVFLLSLVKVNFGFAALAAFVGSVALVNAFERVLWSAQTVRFYMVSLTLLPASIVGVYAFLVRGLPLYAVRQCFPFLPGDYPYHASLRHALNFWLQALERAANADWISRCFTVVVVLSAIQTILLLAKKKMDSGRRKTVAIAALIFCLFFTAFLHEFLLSGTGYAVNWATPFGILLVFLLISVASAPLHAAVRCLLGVTLLLGALSSFCDDTEMLRWFKTPGHFFANERARIYVGNDGEWMHTVQSATQFLENRLRPDETFFAFPYDSLYYFLTGRKSPTRELIFFEHAKMTEAQERDVIANLEKKKVNWVLMSNRTQAAPQEKGIYGASFCRVLAPYLATNFEEVAEFGPWNRTAGWVSNHAVKILHRRLPL